MDSDRFVVVHLDIQEAMEKKMGKLVVAAFTTLDGVSEDPVGFDGNDWGGWALPYFEEHLMGEALASLETATVFVCGRKTYTGFAQFGPAMTGAYAERINGLPKRVASRTLKGPLEWNAQLLEGDAISAIRKLKAESSGDVIVYGGGSLLAQLLADALVDELKLSVIPVTIGGAGQTLFGSCLKGQVWTPTRVNSLTSGVQVVTYVPSGVGG
jgi:dihydrofolate reductase